MMRILTAFLFLAVAVPALAGHPRIASNGNEHLVVWSDARGIRAARLDAAGNLLDPIGFDIPGAQGVASVASAGDDYMVVAAVCDSILAFRVSRYGQVSPPKTVTAPSAQPCLTDVEIASNGSSYLVVADVAALLDLSGNVLAGPFALPFIQAGAASDGHGYMIAGKTTAIEALPVSGRGELGTVRTILQGTAATVASNGQSYVLVATGNAIVTELLAADATPLGPAKLVPTADVTGAPRAVWSGSDYVIAYAQANELLLARASAAGDFTSNGASAMGVSDSTTAAFDLAPALGGTLLTAATTANTIVDALVTPAAVGPLLPISFTARPRRRAAP